MQDNDRRERRICMSIFDKLKNSAMDTVMTAAHTAGCSSLVWHAPSHLSSLMTMYMFIAM